MARNGINTISFLRSTLNNIQLVKEFARSNNELLNLIIKVLSARVS